MRGNYNNFNCFTPGWGAGYPGAWAAAGWGASTAWQGANWNALSSMYGYPQTPMYYDYGTSVVYQGDSVYVNGDNAGSAEGYARQASTLADTGRQADAPKDGNWTPLGVFALVAGDEKSASNTIQLAVNKDGIIRGTYYNEPYDTAETVYGSVDPKTQRAAWSVGDQQSPVYEAGIANLTKEETTILLHDDNGQSRQMSLVRIPPSGGASGK